MRVNALILAAALVLVAIACSAATWTGNGMADAEVFDPATGQFTSIAPMRHPRLHAIAIPLSDGRVLIAGHWDGAVQSISVDPAGPTTEVFE